MIVNIVGWSMTALFAVLAIILLSGRGAFLIAGYNTASKAEKAMYDEKKLCRVVGSGMGSLAIIMAIMTTFGHDGSSWTIGLLSVVIIVIVIVMLVLCNTICKAKNPPTDYYTNEALSSKPSKKLVAFIVVSIIGYLMVTIAPLITGDIKTTINDTELNIVGSYWFDYAVPLDIIEAVSLKEDINLGKRTNGMGSLKLSEGNFRNTEFGNYTLYAYNKCNTYIILDTTDGKVVVNGETPEETKELYEKIVEALQ